MFHSIQPFCRKDKRQSVLTLIRQHIPSPAAMRFTIATLALSALTSVLGATVTVSFDQTYDNSGGSLATVSCSDGQNGMLTKGSPNVAFSQGWLTTLLWSRRLHHLRFPTPFPQHRRRGRCRGVQLGQLWDVLAVDLPGHQHQHPCD